MNVMMNIVFLTGLLSCAAFFAHGSHVLDNHNDATINTMPAEQALEVMLYLKNHCDKNFVTELFQRSKNEMSIPKDWEKFIVDEIKNHNTDIIQALSGVGGCGLYNYLSYKNGNIFIKSNLLFSFVLNMQNWPSRHMKIVLKKEDYSEMKQVLLKALDFVIQRNSQNPIAKTNQEKIAYFLSYSFVNLSYPSLVIMDKALAAARGAPQQKMWVFAAQDDFYRTLNHVIQAEVAATEDSWNTIETYTKARNTIISIAHEGYDIMRNMIGNKVLTTCETLDASFDRAEASYMLASLHVLAWMVEYSYVSTYFAKAYLQSSHVLKDMPDDVAKKLLEKIKHHMSLIAEVDDTHPLLKNLMQIL